jgi:hydrogenase/urease accessory protein HupE
VTRWLFLLLAMVAAPALADELRPGSVQIVEVARGSWDLSWKQPLAGPGTIALVVPELPASCAFTAPPGHRAAPLALIGHANARCQAPLSGQRIAWQGVTGRGDALLRVVPLGRPVQTFRLTAENPSAIIAAKPSRFQVLRTYFVLGVTHILGGWDHLLFVIALVLLVARVWPVVRAATAFTLAHSLTLAAVTLGFAGLPQRPVEATIALSIVFLAVELARGSSAETLTRRLPWLVAFAFGLVHGFGFAGALREIGLPEGEVPAALVSFNLGVEAGQLAVIAAVLAIRALLNRIAPARASQLIHAASYAIGITGSYWLLDRVIG